MRRTLLPLLLLPALVLGAPAHAAAPLDVVVNEVAWMGSVTSATSDEWIELYNNTDAAIDLAGWMLEDDGADYPALSGTIPAKGFFLIERTETATSVPADLLIATLSWGNTGDRVVLKDAAGAEIDVVETGSGWFAGSNTAPKYTMERISTTTAAVATNWASNDGVTRNGTDSGGLAINGTPKAANSTTNDVSAPGLRVVLSPDTTSLLLFFTEAVTAATAEVPANYTVGGAVPGAATLDAAGRRQVTLTGLTGLNPGDLATLTVAGVADDAGNVLSEATATFFVSVLPISRVQADDAAGVPSIDPAAFVTVDGWVAATVFSLGEAQIFDPSGGVTVFDDDARAAFTVGDLVRVAGKVTHYNGKTEIGSGRGMTAWQIQAQGEDVPVLVLDLPTYLTDPESFEGLLLGFRDLSKVAGETWPTPNNNQNLQLADAGARSLLVRIDRDTDIDEAAEPTWPQHVVGVASQYVATAPYIGGYQVQPRAIADFGASLCDCAPDTMASYWCTAGTCEVVACAEWQDDCDGDPANGCEIDTATDTANCGACDVACDAGAWCLDGACAATCPDADGDGYSDPRCGGDDCNDADANVHPGATEICGNSQDDNCDGAVDEGCATCVDLDQDGHEDAACGGDDCDDQLASVNPSATEVCGNNVDDDCDGSTDEECEICADADGDGYTAASCGGTDCNDADPAVNPGAAEVCGNAIDDNCNGSPDEGCETCADADADGFQDASCGGLDCNDADPDVSPDADEVCEGTVDENCDGNVDEGCACPDADGDGSCDDVDCDDTDAAIHPGAIEVCGNGVDEDCSGADLVCGGGGDPVDEGCGCAATGGSGLTALLAALGLLLFRRRRA